MKLTKPTENWKPAAAKAEDRWRVLHETVGMTPEHYYEQVTNGKGQPPGYTNPAFDEGQTKF